MSTKVIIKKSSVVGKVPTVSQLDHGELALNYADGKLYYKNSSNAIAEVNSDTVYTHPSSHPISMITGLQSALDGKVDDSQVLTNVPSGAVFTDTTYSVGDGGLTQKNFTTTLKTKLDGIATGANNYTHPASHAISVITGLQSALDDKAPLASPGLTGTPTAPTAAANTNTTQIATTAYVQTEITDLIGGAPGALDTLNELAAAINDDSSYASTVTTALGGKEPTITAGTSSQYWRGDKSWQTLNTTAVAEGTNQYFTNARARSAISVTDSGGDGSLSYNSSTGVLTYTGPSASEVRAHLSAGTGVSYSSGQFSIGQAVGTSDSPMFNNLTTSGKIDAGTIVRNNSRASSSQEYPLGHYATGDTVFEIDPTWSTDELQNYFDSTDVTWDTDSTAPGGYSIQIDNSVGVGAPYGSGFPYIPVDQDDEFYMECWIKNDGTVTHYMGSNDRDHNLSNLGGNPGSYGYWVMSNTNPGTSWTKVSGYIGGFHASNTGDFETGTKYWTPLALFNYTHSGGTRRCWISGWKVIKVKHHGNRNFTGSVTIQGGTAWHSSNDGAGSGMDADLLDGQQGTHYRVDIYNVSGTLLN